MQPRRTPARYYPVVPQYAIGLVCGRVRMHACVRDVSEGPGGENKRR